jgi:hypothetical protein
MAAEHEITPTDPSDSVQDTTKVKRKYKKVAEWDAEAQAAIRQGLGHTFQAFIARLVSFKCDESRKLSQPSNVCRI